MNWEIVLLCHWKKHTISVDHGQGKVPAGYERQSVPITLNELVTPGTIGFDALHEKLGVLAIMHKFELKVLIRSIALSSVVRRITIMRECHIPQFVAQYVLQLLKEHNACVGGGGLRKTSSYADFLLHHVGHQERTIPSINSRKTDNKYVLPDDVDEMTVEMLMEELRFAEEKAAKPALLEKLRGLLRGQQAVDREKSRKGKPQSEMDLIKSVIDAEYDDVPTRKKGKKA